jgi:hypothetical protein
MFKKCYPILVASVMLSSGAMAANPVGYSSYVQLALAENTATPEGLSQLVDVEKKYEQYLAAADRNSGYKSVAKYTTMAVVIGGLGVAFSNTEETAEGKREFTQEGKVGLGAAIVGGVIGGLLTSHFNSKSREYKGKAEALSKGLTYDAQHGAMSYKISYAF